MLLFVFSPIVFNDDIKKAIQSDLQSAFASEVSKLNSELQGENVMVPVGTPIQGVGRPSPYLLTSISCAMTDCRKRLGNQFGNI